MTILILEAYDFVIYVSALNTSNHLKLIFCSTRLTYHLIPCGVPLLHVGSHFLTMFFHFIRKLNSIIYFASTLEISTVGLQCSSFEFYPPGIVNCTDVVVIWMSYPRC